MHFDDRLDTVLRLPPMGDAFARIQYRQLLDILGSTHGDAQGPKIDSAYLRLAELSAAIPDSERAEMLRQSHSRLQSPRLLAILADSEPSVASAAIATAQMSENDWLALIPALPVRARGILRYRWGLGPRIDRLLTQLGISDRGLPPAENYAPFAIVESGDDEPLELVDLAPMEDAPDKPLQSAPTSDDKMTTLQNAEPENDIAMLLKRIEEFRRTRRAGVQPNDRPPDAPHLPLEGHEEEFQAKRAAPFDFATDALGHITWADAAVAPMVVGLRLVPSDHDNAPGALADAMQALRYRRDDCMRYSLCPSGYRLTVESD